MLSEIVQAGLNKLTANLPSLVEDGKFGPKTQSRVKEFQRSKGLKDDGIVGSLTMAAFLEALRLLGLLPTPPATGAVRSINTEILGMNAPGNLVPQILPSIEVISEATFRPGVVSNAFSFRSTAPNVGRLGIFAAKKGVRRAGAHPAPPGDHEAGSRHHRDHPGHSGMPIDTVGPLVFNNPLSPKLIPFVLLSHVIFRRGLRRDPKVERALPHGRIGVLCCIRRGAPDCFRTERPCHVLL